MFHFARKRGVRGKERKPSANSLTYQGRLVTSHYRGEREREDQTNPIQRPKTPLLPLLKNVHPFAQSAWGGEAVARLNLVLTLLRRRRYLCRRAELTGQEGPPTPMPLSPLPKLLSLPPPSRLPSRSIQTTATFRRRRLPLRRRSRGAATACCCCCYGCCCSCCCSSCCCCC